MLIIHPPLTPPIKGVEHTPTPLSRGDLSSPLVGEGGGEGGFIVYKQTLYNLHYFAVDFEASRNLLQGILKM